MKIDNSTVLITGANRDIGLAFAKAFIARGAREVYAGARDPSKISLAGVRPVQLDVSSAADVKAALWSLSNGLRTQGTQVLTLHMGFVDTDLTKGIDMPKSSPEAIVDRALFAPEAGEQEVLADAMTQQVKHSLSTDQAAYRAVR